MKLISKVGILVFCISVSLGILSFTPVKQIAKHEWNGIASYYHSKFNGRKTATGEIFSNKHLTAANNFLKLGTIVKVTNVKNGKSVIVKINDRMNIRNRRLIDLSQAAASKLGLLQQGIGEVCIELLSNQDDYLASR